jgi:putative transposase
VLLPLLPRRGLRRLVPLVPVTRSDGPATPLRWRVPACNSLAPPSQYAQRTHESPIPHVPDSRAGGVLRGHCAHAWFVYNLGLEQRSWWQPGRRSIHFVDQCRELTAARAENPWLAEGSSVVQQQALLVGQSFGIQQLSARWGEVRVPKGGRIRFRLSRPLPEGVKSCRINRDCSGRWHASFPGPQPAVSRRPTGAMVGLDRGVAVSVATSDGELLHAPKQDSEQRCRMRRLQRRLARQTKGSNRSARTKLAIGRLKAKERDRRKDWVEKTSTHLVQAYDTVVLESLQVHRMTRSAKGTRERPGRNVRQKAGLNREILASGWGELARRVKEKGEASGVSVVEVSGAFSSQTCVVCWSVRQENRESQAVFHCRDCGHRANADVNAAVVIRERGIWMLAPAAGHAVAARGVDRNAGATNRELTLAASAARPAG